jgi:hypothetical protein
MERLGYKRLGSFLEDYQDSAELAHAVAYLYRDDEIQTNRLIYAIVRAFNGDGKTKKPAVDDDDEEIIDTTDPTFAEHFKGFTGVPGSQAKRPFNQRSQGGTQLIKG